MGIPVCVVDETGIHAPTYGDILTYLQESYRDIYGEDVYLEPDSQDGQLLAIFAAAVNDVNAMAVAVYNAFSPSSARGVGLSIVVKINGIARAIATYSTVDLVIVGQAGTTIVSGAALDDDGTRWNLPASVVIPSSGSITVTATAALVGAVSAPAHTVTVIGTPTRGWQSVDNPASAALGAPVESDAALRRRQTTSTALPSNTILEGIIGSVAQIDGVTRYAAYENDTDATDGNGIPSHSIALIVEGGDAQTIGETIAAKKTPGSGTAGSTTVTVTDTYGIAHAIKFSRPIDAPVKVAIKLKALSGYTTTIEAAIKAAVAGYIDGLAIGDDVLLTRLYVPANLGGGAGSTSFELTQIQIALVSGTLGGSDIIIAYNAAASCDVANVTVTVV